MSVVNVFFGSYCGAEEVIRGVVEKTGYRYLDDTVLIAETGKRYGMDESRIRKALIGKPSVFNKFTHEKERSVACLRRVLADFLAANDMVVAGLSSLMVPRTVAHALNVCLIANMRYRTALACRVEMISEKEAVKRIHREDETLSLWAEHVFRKTDPWDAGFYDMVVPMNKFSRDEVVCQICENLNSGVLCVSEESRKAVQDFALASEVGVKLAGEGHDVSVTAKDGRIFIEINRHVLLLSALEEELSGLAMTVPGVVDVETKVGPGFYQSDIYRKFDFDAPSKVLLVDDEREFVETLSERLQMRDYISAVVYGGEEALSVVDEDEPEVMVLDLKMPGIDGLEVLRQVKRKHPNVEVIVLTGHGSKDIETLCKDLGAFAYLEKPVDIDKLTQMMQEAYQKVRKSAVKAK